MLYDTRWDQPKRDIFSTASLIEWLETKDPKQRYMYTHCTECLLAQYFTAMGLKNVRVTPSMMACGEDMTRPSHYALPPGWDEVAQGNGCGLSDWTFGKALKRARRLANRSTPGLIQKVLEFFKS